MPIPSPETMAKVASWREAARAGTLTLEDTREAIKFLRADRLAMPESKSRTAKPAIDVGALFGELDKL